MARESGKLLRSGGTGSQPGGRGSRHFASLSGGAPWMQIVKGNPGEEVSRALAVCK